MLYLYLSLNIQTQSIIIEIIKLAYQRAVAKYHLDYNPAADVVLNAIIGLGLEIEICDAWIWVSGNTEAHKETLKAAHYQAMREDLVDWGAIA